MSLRCCTDAVSGSVSCWLSQLRTSISRTASSASTSPISVSRDRTSSQSRKPRKATVPLKCLIFFARRCRSISVCCTTRSQTSEFSPYPRAICTMCRWSIRDKFLANSGLLRISAGKFKELSSDICKKSGTPEGVPIISPSIEITGHLLVPSTLIFIPVLAFLL